MDLFAYGTLQFDEVWGRVTGREFPTVAGRAAGFAAYRVDGYDFPAIIPAEGGSTAGTVYLGIDQATLARLDAFEGDFYERWTIDVEREGGENQPCQAYVLPARSGLLTHERWTCDSFLSSGGLERFLARYDGFERTDRNDAPDRR